MQRTTWVSGSAALSCGKAPPFRGRSNLNLVPILGLRLRLNRRGAASPSNQGKEGEGRKGRAFPQDRAAEPHLPQHQTRPAVVQRRGVHAFPQHADAMLHSSRRRWKWGVPRSRIEHKHFRLDVAKIKRAQRSFHKRCFEAARFLDSNNGINGTRELYHFHSTEGPCRPSNWSKRLSPRWATELPADL